MAYNRKTWVARQGTGLNKFRIGDDPIPKPLVNDPDSVDVEGDALSAQNFNDFEGRIEAGFNEVNGQVNGKVGKGGDTMTGSLILNGAGAVGTAQGRNIYAGTSDMIAGSSALATGAIYFVYE